MTIPTKLAPRSTASAHVRSWALAALALTVAAGCATNRPASQPPLTATENYYAGVKAARAGDTAEAIQRLNESIRQNPTSIMPRSVLGDVYRSQNKLELALQPYQDLTRLDPYGVSGHVRLGLTLQLLGRLEESAASYTRALELDPTDAIAQRNLGTVYLALGRGDEAANYLGRAAGAFPDSPDVWANYGVALDLVGRYAEAETAYRRSLDLDPKQSATLISLGTNLTTQHRPNEAIAVLNDAIALSDTPLARVRRAQALVAAGRHSEAIAAYDAILAVNPRHTPSINGKGMAAIDLYVKGLELDESLRTQALGLWKQSLAIRPDQPAIAELVARWGPARG